MNSLSEEQFQILLDYALGVASEDEALQAQSLISSNTEACEIHMRIKASLSPLESLEVESCPDELVERTVLRLNEQVRSSQRDLERLLAAEQRKMVPAAVSETIWAAFGKRLATAAVFMIVGGLLITSVNIISSYARQSYFKQQCQMQLANIWRGINNYTADNEGKLPAVASSSGSPWWKVGYQGNENHSNTRGMWLLAKGDYVEPTNFCCPGSTGDRKSQLDAAELKDLQDFPSRKDVTYSFRVMCQAAKVKDADGKTILIADLNPLFESLPADYTSQFKLCPTKRLLTINSVNHNRCGQNVMFCDGSVRFVRNRKMGITEDDIFTLQDVKVYQGCEVPSCESDSFLAP
jgi:hypothetical protein